MSKRTFWTTALMVMAGVAFPLYAQEPGQGAARLEIINLFDNPWYAAMTSLAYGNTTSFGKVESQGNYSRTFQVTGRFSF